MIFFQVRDENETLIQTGLTPENLLIGPETSGFHLNTFDNVDCVHCYQPHFYGQKIEEASPINKCSATNVCLLGIYNILFV